MPIIITTLHIVGKNDRKLSIIMVYRDTQKAFIYGALLSALGLLRGVMERVLVECYRAQGANLEIMIKKCNELDPSMKIKAEQVRIYGNNALHAGEPFHPKVSSTTVSLRLLRHQDTVFVPFWDWRTLRICWLRLRQYGPFSCDS